MDSTARQRTQQYISARRQHPAWLLLASPRAPLVLGCLTSLFEFADNGISEEDALQALAEMLAEYAAQDEFSIDPDNTHLLAGRELRQWIKRGLVVERGGRIYASDALSLAIGFIDSLDNRIMTTTASRLSVKLPRAWPGSGTRLRSGRAFVGQRELALGFSYRQTHGCGLCQQYGIGSGTCTALAGSDCG